ncbi:MAG: Re/Si-specific NAD(P)(+) transhydrogenase subunit beta [Gammaproteobacteria bacterium]
MTSGIVTGSYIIAAVLFIFSLGGLSHPRTARRGNFYGMVGMVIAIAVTILLLGESANLKLLASVMLIGALIGLTVAYRVQMTEMPELVAVLHSFVGMAAVLIGFATYLDGSDGYVGVAKVIHEVEIYIGVLIGAVTFSGSVIAFGKLKGIISGRPLLLPARHWINLGLGIASVFLGVEFVSTTDGTSSLLIMTAIALLFGVHMVMAIGGADMPVVVSMLNSYSGWAAAATGFMLSNDLLIVTGALVGSSGAILSYIMCRAMNRNFISVIAGGFGTGSSSVSSATYDGEVNEILSNETADILREAGRVIIVPGYGMAVAQAQNTVSEISNILNDTKKDVRFAIHPVAGRMPGHMNVLLAEARVSYDVVFEMDEINGEFTDTDVVLVVGANDIVNPSALSEPESPIAGMPVLEVWNAATVVVLKRGMASGYAGVDNPLFFNENTRMLFGDAKQSLDSILSELSR